MAFTSSTVAYAVISVSSTATVAWSAIVAIASTATTIAWALWTVAECFPLQSTTGVVDPQVTAIDLLASQLLHTSSGALLIGELSMGETSWLAGTSVDCNSDVNNVADILEQSIQIGIGHLEGQISDEKCLAWRVLRSFSWLRSNLVVADDFATCELGIIESLDGSSSFLDRGKVDIAEPSTVNTRS